MESGALCVTTTLTTSLRPSPAVNSVSSQCRLFSLLFHCVAQYQCARQVMTRNTATISGTLWDSGVGQPEWGKTFLPSGVS